MNQLDCQIYAFWSPFLLLKVLIWSPFHSKLGLHFDKFRSPIHVGAVEIKFKNTQITDMSTSLATWLKSLPPLLATLAESGEHTSVIMGEFDLEF